MRPLPQFKSTIALVPHSGIQFLDFGFDLDGAQRVNRSFLETEDSESDGKVLHALINEDGELRHPVTHEPTEPSYTINLQRALEPYLGAWTPVPFMRLLGRDQAGRDVFDQGPSNWARVYVEEADPSSEGEKSYRVVLALDTELDTRERSAERAYLSPTLTDARSEETFGFSGHEDDVAWFLSEAWVDQWLEESFHDLMRRRDRNKRFKPENLPNALEHAARYLTFLQALEQLCRFPKIRLVDNVSAERSYSPIGVDLVIDVGNSRTWGILIERDPDRAMQLDLSNSYTILAGPVPADVRACAALREPH